MFYFLSLLCGALVPVQVLFNSVLAGQHGLYFANIAVHLTGLVFVSGIMLFTRVRSFGGRHKWWLYLGGVLGVFTVVANTVAFARINMSAVMALTLFGQSLAGLVTDQFGWLGLSKHPFKKKRVIGIMLTLGGIAVMCIGQLDALAVIISLIAGVNILISRMLNGKLADLTNVQISTFFNYLTGLLVSIPLFLLIGFLGTDEVFQTALSFSPDVYMYFGGFAGAILVLICNYTVPRVPAFYLSLLLFIGQVFASIVIDTIKDRSFSMQLLIGGIFVTIGLCADMYFDKAKIKEASQG